MNKIINKKFPPLSPPLLKIFCASLFYILFSSASAAPATIRFLDQDLKFTVYNSLNLIQSESDINGIEWRISNDSGQSSRVGSTLSLPYPAIFYQQVSLEANEEYIMAFTAIGTDFEHARLRVRDSLTRKLIVVEPISLRNQLYTYPVTFTAPKTASYDIEIISFPNISILRIDWGMMGLFKKSDLIAVGAKWPKFSIWADSMGIYWPKQLKARLSVPDYIDGAVGGEKSTEILARAVQATDFGDKVIIWAGNNNSRAPETVISDIKQIIALLPHDRFVVISLHNNATFNNSTQTYDNVIEINNQLSNDFGNKYIDTRSYLISNADITSEDDLADAAAGIVPRSFRSDIIHLNAKGRDLVSGYVAARLESLYQQPITTTVPSKEVTPPATTIERSSKGCSIAVRVSSGNTADYSLVLALIILIFLRLAKKYY